MVHSKQKKKLQSFCHHFLSKREKKIIAFLDDKMEKHREKNTIYLAMIFSHAKSFYFLASIFVFIFKLSVFNVCFCTLHCAASLYYYS